MKLSERMRNMSLSWTAPYEKEGLDLFTEVAQLEAKLMAVECGECGKTLLECDFEECDKQASK